MNKLPALAAALAALLPCASLDACEGLVASSGWIRQPPPGMSHAAGYLTLSNEGQHAVVIDGVSSPDFASAMLHETRYNDGRAQMRHVHTLEIAPGEHVEARPGGLHLMLMQPRVELASDVLVEVDIACSTGEPLATWLVVRRTPPSPASD
ncbi:MAG: copper chaperone PCu(A)C [Gammaproteobacteria bacterium]